MGAHRFWKNAITVDMRALANQYAVRCDDMDEDWEKLYRTGAVLAGQGRYSEALKMFACAVKIRPDDPVLQAYFGLCLAASEHKLGVGLKVCEQALEKNFFQPELYLVLARVYLVAGSRRRSFQTLIKGLKVEPDNRLLREEVERLNSRRNPVFSFLSRDNMLNVFAGKMRHRLIPKA